LFIKKVIYIKYLGWLTVISWAKAKKNQKSYCCYCRGMVIQWAKIWCSGPKNWKKFPTKIASVALLTSPGCPTKKGAFKAGSGEEMGFNYDAR
jgi:hypothetical protein